jgi:hypothetical protein
MKFYKIKKNKEKRESFIINVIGTLEKPKIPLFFIKIPKKN